MRDTLRTCIGGGSNHWLRIAAFVMTRGADNHEEHVGAIGCSDVKRPAKTFDNITVATIDLGFRRLIDGTVSARTDIVAAALLAFRDPDSADIDAEAADVILQTGLIGRVAYRRRRAARASLAESN